MYYFIFYRTITRNDLVEYISTHYKGPRMVLSASGGKRNTITIVTDKWSNLSVMWKYI